MSDYNSANSAQKRSKGVTIFAALLVLFALFPISVLIRTLVSPIYTVHPGTAAIYLAMALVLIILASGILMLKNWARVICLWITCIWGISIISVGFSMGPTLLSEPNDFVILGVLFYAFCVVGPVIFLLNHRAIKRQFR